MCFTFCIYGMFCLLCIIGMFCIWLWIDYDQTRADKKLSPFFAGASKWSVKSAVTRKGCFLTPSIPFRTKHTSLVGEERLCWAPKKSQECGLPSVDGEPPRQTHTLLLTTSERLGKQKHRKKLEKHTRCLSRTRNNFENTTQKYLTNTPIANYCTTGQWKEGHRNFGT